MVLSCIRQSNWSSVSVVILLVKSSHKLSRVRVNFDWSIIDFTHSLYLYIISPNSKLTFMLTIRLYRFVRHKTFKIIPTSQYILHTFLTHNDMLIAISINLMCNTIKQTITITLNFYSLEPM
jgi:hypothetical protein